MSWQPNDDVSAIDASMPLLRREGVCANHKRVYRLYRAAGLAVQRRRKRRRTTLARQPLLLPQAPNQVWSMDFVMDALDSGRRLKCLTLVDDFTKEAIEIVLDHSIPGVYVARVLDQVGRFRGLPGRSGPTRDRSSLAERSINGLTATAWS